jgi:hypothetical protein
MTTALIKKMKNTLGLDRQTLKMLADTSRKDLSGITILTEEQKQDVIFTKTSGVKVEKLTQYLCETFGDDHETPIKLDIYPLMLQQLCHSNARDFAKSFDMNVCLGFNITACECGDFISFEIHSVPVDKDGKYYDITEDFYGEKEKWFYPVHTIPNNDLKTFMWRVREMLGQGSGYCFSEKKHTCGKKQEPLINKALTLEEWKAYQREKPLSYSTTDFEGGEAINTKKKVAEFVKKCKMIASVNIVCF